jgi:hypothetical protein
MESLERSANVLARYLVSDLIPVGHLTFSMFEVDSRDSIRIRAARDITLS